MIYTMPIMRLTIPIDADTHINLLPLNYIYEAFREEGRVSLH
jgi:hypothetical protein